MASLIIGILIAGYCGYIIYREVKKKKNGGGCSCCGGSCAGCSSRIQESSETSCQKNGEHK